MSDDREYDKEGFLQRWSRVKSEARESAAAPAAPAAEPRDSAAEAEPALPSLDEITFDSDFRGFLHPKVDEDVRRQALRKLFSDPHFNVMDGLDVYIDDYSKTEPIPAAMLAGLKQAQRILEWAAEKPAEKQPPTETPPSTDVEPEPRQAERQRLAADIEEPALRVEQPAGAMHNQTELARDQDA